MDPLKIAKEALKNLWAHKVLWFFGLFLGARGGGGGAPLRGVENGAHELSGWLVPVLIGAGLVALASLAMHLVSEAALIEGVRRNRAGEPLRIGAGVKVGLRHFWRVLGVKVLAGLGILATVLVVAVPAGLGLLGLYPAWLGAVATLPLVLLAIPWLLTVYFVYIYALRFAVLDGHGATAALRDARGYLRGRVLDSLKLLVVAFLGQVGAGLAVVVLFIPVAALAAILYFTVGLVPAIVVGATLAVPIALTITGALGAYRSSVWTLGFLESRTGAAS